MSPAVRRRPLLLGALASCVLPARAGSTDDRVAATVDGVMRPLMAAHAIPGLAVGLTWQGQRHLFHYGLASKADGRPVTPETLFEIGSLSKTFTATLACRAQALGQLSLADSPARFLPQLRGTPLAAATLLHLGTYTAGGLPLQFPDDVKDLADAMAWFRAWKPEARPGEQRRYSNPSIGLLGHVAALSAQASFVEMAEGELFPALGLRNTFLRVPPAHREASAWGYDKADAAVRVNPGVFDAQAYGIKTTAGDLLRFVEAQLAPAALPPTLRRAVEGTQRAHFRVGPLAQGLGWEQYPFPVSLEQLQAGNAATMALAPHPAQALAPPQANTAATLFNKTGSTNGFGAYAAFVPARRFGIVLLANRNIPNAARVEAAHTILAQLASPASPR
jgi:beta-lactamase class C